MRWMISKCWNGYTDKGCVLEDCLEPARLSRKELNPQLGSMHDCACETLTSHIETHWFGLHRIEAMWT